MKNFQKNNYLLEEESENSDQEGRIERPAINEFSFKKKKNEGKEEEEKQKDIVATFEEDLNQYYSKKQKNEMEKKFLKIQDNFSTKNEKNGSMKNIFSSVKKMFF